MYQDVGFYDASANSAGELAEFLAAKVSLLEALFGENLHNVVRSLATIFVSLLVMYLYQCPWQLSLVATAAIPVYAFTIAARVRAMGIAPPRKGVKDKSAEKNKSAGAVITEAVFAVRTIASLNAQHAICSSYKRGLESTAQANRKSHTVTALWDGISNGLIPPMLGVMLFYGFYLSAEGQIPPATTECVEAGAPAVEKTMIPTMIAMAAGAGFNQIILNLTDMSEAEAAVDFFGRSEALVSAPRSPTTA